jgi:DNA gyrase subunit A
MNVTDKTGRVVRAMLVHDTDDLMIMTTSGQSVRIPVEQIRETGRNAQGVKLINLKEGESIQDVARVAREEEVVDDSSTESGDEAVSSSEIPPIVE